MKELRAKGLGVYIADSDEYGMQSPRKVRAQQSASSNNTDSRSKGPRIQNYFNRSYWWTAGFPLGASSGLLGIICVFAFALGDRWENHSDSVVKSVAAYGTVSYVSLLP